MGKSNNIFIKSLCMIIFVLFVLGCNNKKEIAKVEFNEYDYKQDIDEFDITNLTLKVTYNDGTYEDVLVNKNMISFEDNAKLKTLGIHKIELTYHEIKLLLNVELTDFYEVKYMINSEVIDEQIIERGGNSNHPNLDAKEGYTFLGWDNDGKNITEDTVITGTYALNKYKVNFVIDGEVIESQIINYGEDSINPEIPNKEGYIFSGWDNDGKNITEDTVITGTYALNKYKVDFMIDGKIVETQKIEYGKDCVLPQLNVDGYIIKGWDSAGINITKDTVINAIFEREKYNVKYYGREDILISTINDMYGFNEEIVIDTYGYVNADVEILVNGLKLSKVDKETYFEYRFNMPKEDISIEIKVNQINDNEKIYRIDKNNRINLIEQNSNVICTYGIHFDYPDYPSIVIPDGIDFETENKLREEYNKEKNQYYELKNLELIKELNLEIYLEKYTRIGKTAYFAFGVDELSEELKYTFNSLNENNNVSRISLRFDSDLNKAIIDIDYLGFKNDNILDYTKTNIDISNIYLLEKGFYDSYEKLCNEVKRLVEEKNNLTPNASELITKAYSRFDESFFEENVLIYCGDSRSATGYDKHYISNVYVKDGKVSVVVEIEYANGGILNVHEENHIIIISKADYLKYNVVEAEVLYIYSVPLR